MESGKGFCETLRRLITVAKGNVDHFLIHSLQVQCRQIQSAVSDVFSDPVTRHQRKSSLQKERGKEHLPGHILRTDVVCKVILHVIDCCPNRGKPLHCFASSP